MKYLSLILALLFTPCCDMKKEDPPKTSFDSKEPSEARVKSEIILNVMEDGSMRVENMQVTREELSKKLKMIVVGFKDQSVMIRGDRKIPYGTIVDVIELCQKAGIWNISFATLPTQENAPSNGG